MSARGAGPLGWATLLLIAPALYGCQTTAERSAQLEREAKRAAASAPQASAGLEIKRASAAITVVQTLLLHGSERTAGVVTLRNRSDRALRGVPLEITAKDTRGATVYTNTAAGLTPALTSVGLLPARGELTWVDDQLTGAAHASTLSARAGEGSAAAAALPHLRLAGAHSFEDPANGPSEEGTLVNESHVSQQELVIFAVARQGAAIKAVGRAVLPEAPAGTSTRFQIVFVGDPRGAQLALSAPPTTIG